MDHSFSIDILVFALIAAVLFVRLRKVLGERSDGQPPGGAPPHIDPAVLLKARQMVAKTDPALLKAGDKAAALSAPVNWAHGMPDYQLVLNATAHHRLLPLAAVDPNFQPQNFLQGARRAYELIVVAFAKGDVDALDKLLTPALLATFKTAIETHRESGQQLDVVLQNMKRAVISDASLDGTQAYIDVDFTTEQNITLRDKDGQTIDGQDGTTQNVHERWTFTNNLKDGETIWRLSETDHLDA